MAEAWIRGKAAALDAAVTQAAKLLAASKMPVIAGLGTDVAGARAAIKLAQRLGGVVDHMHSAALLRDLDVMRESGMMVTTPNEARLRADLLLLVGPGLVEAWPDFPARLFKPPKGESRRIVWLCAGRAERNDPANLAALLAAVHAHVDFIGEDPADLPVLLAALRARVGGRPVGKMPFAEQIKALAADLPKVRFGVAVWSSTALDGLTIEMLCDLVKDLNQGTRFTGLPLAPSDNAAAVQQVSGWLTGFPLRTGFSRGYAEHDPWRFDAARLIDSGEADCAVWIATQNPAAPPWQREVPLIALTSEPIDFRSVPEVAMTVGCPGFDHDAITYAQSTGTLVALGAIEPNDTTSVAEAIDRIAAALPAALPC